MFCNTPFLAWIFIAKYSCWLINWCAFTLLLPPYLLLPHQISLLLHYFTCFNLSYIFVISFHVRSGTVGWLYLLVQIKNPFVQLDLYLVTVLCIFHCAVNTWRTRHYTPSALWGKCDWSNYYCLSFYSSFSLKLLYARNKDK